MKSYGTFAEDEYKDVETLKQENYEEANAHFRARLSKLLSDRDVRKQDFADEIGMSPGSVSGYLSGKHNPDVATLLAIADFFDVSLDYLYGRTDYTYIYKGDLTPVENEVMSYLRKIKKTRKYEILGEIRGMYRSDSKEPDRGRKNEKKDPEEQ